MRKYMILACVGIITLVLSACSFNQSAPQPQPSTSIDSNVSSNGNNDRHKKADVESKVEVKKSDRFPTYFYGKSELGDGNYQLHYMLKDKKEGFEYLVVTTGNWNNDAGIGTTVLLDETGKNPYMGKGLEPSFQGERFVVSDYGSHELIGENIQFHYVLTDKETNVQYMIVTSSVWNNDSGVSITPIFKAKS